MQKLLCFFVKRGIISIALTGGSVCMAFESADNASCRSGGTGRRTGLKILRSKIRTGSIPVFGTKIQTEKAAGFFVFRLAVL